MTLFSTLDVQSNYEFLTGTLNSGNKYRVLWFRSEKCNNIRDINKLEHFKKSNLWQQFYSCLLRNNSVSCGHYS